MMQKHIDLADEVHILELEVQKVELENRLAQLKAEPTIDGGCVGCCNVVDVAAKLQEELESTRNMYRSSSDECCGQRKTIGDLRTKIWELERTLPENFWDVVAKKDATIRKQRNTIEELKDRNAEDLYELYVLDKKEIDWLRNVVSARDLSIKSPTAMCQSSGTERNKLSAIIDEKDKMLEKQVHEISGMWGKVNALEAELSARKHDSAVLMEVVEIVKRDDNCPTIINQLVDLLVDYLDAPEGPPETPIDEPQEITVTFAFLELP